MQHEKLQPHGLLLVWLGDGVGVITVVFVAVGSFVAVAGGGRGVDVGGIGVEVGGIGVSVGSGVLVAVGVSVGSGVSVGAMVSVAVGVLGSDIVSVAMGTWGVLGSLTMSTLLAAAPAPKSDTVVGCALGNVRLHN